MNYVFALAGIFIGIYTWSYGRWLKRRQGNKAGAILIATMALACFTAPVYRFMTSP